MSGILKALNGERFTVICICVALFIIAWFGGCQPKVSSMIDPQRKVTRAVLLSEIDMIIAQAQDKLQTLDQKEALKKLINQQAILIGSTGQINWLGLLTSAAGIVGAGALVDNVKKGNRIKDLQKTNPQSKVTV